MHTACFPSPPTQAVVDSAEAWSSVVGFLLRRRPTNTPAAPLAADPRALLLQVGTD